MPIPRSSWRELMRIEQKATHGPLGRITQKLSESEVKAIEKAGLQVTNSTLPVFHGYKKGDATFSSANYITPEITLSFLVLFWLTKTKTKSIYYMLYLLLVTRTKSYLNSYSPLKKQLKFQFSL